MAADFSPTGLRVLREVAQAGSFSAAAHTLGYTQSAVSRQVAALETVAGRRLFERGRSGVVLTPAGARLLPRAIRVLDELDAARRETAGEALVAGPVRLGAFATAAAGLVPRALTTLPPELKVTLREGDDAGADPRAAGGNARPRDPRALAPVPVAGRRSAPARADDDLGARTGPRRGRDPPVRRRAGGRGRAARGSGLGRQPFGRGRFAARRVAGPARATRRALRRPRLAGQAADRRRGARHHDDRAGHARRPAAPASGAVAVRGEPHETRRVVLAHRPGPLDAPAARVADALLTAGSG